MHSARACLLCTPAPRSSFSKPSLPNGEGRQLHPLARVGLVHRFAAPGTRAGYDGAPLAMAAIFTAPEHKALRSGYRLTMSSHLTGASGRTHR